jgi:hypothetical protein
MRGGDGHGTKLSDHLSFQFLVFYQSGACSSFLILSTAQKSKYLLDTSARSTADYSETGNLRSKPELILFVFETLKSDFAKEAENLDNDQRARSAIVGEGSQNDIVPPRFCQPGILNEVTKFLSNEEQHGHWHESSLSDPCVHRDQAIKTDPLEQAFIGQVHATNYHDVLFTARKALLTAKWYRNAYRHQMDSVL